MPQLQLEDPTGFIQIEIQKSIDLVSFALQVSDKVNIDRLSIPGVPFHFTAAGDRVMDVDDAREEFRVWVLGNGLRDCVDAIGPGLAWARKACFIWTRSGEVSVNQDGTLHLSAKFSGEEWNKNMVREGADFEFFPLRKKIEFLKETYGLSLSAASDEVLSINYARNCLTHRRGIVGPEDMRDGSSDKLVVRWKKLQLTVHDKEGSREVVPPAKFEAGDKISVGYSDVTKEFDLGERIEFTPEEFPELALTFALFAVQIQEAIQELQQSRRPGQVNSDN